MSASQDETFEKIPVILTLTLDNSRPIELGAFVGAFTSLAREFRESSRSNDDFESEATIYVREVRSGSIVADLIPYAVASLPVLASNIEHIGLAVDFVNTWRDRISSLARGIIPPGFSKSDLKSFNDAVEAIARDPNASSTLEAATFEDGKRNVRAAFKFKTSDAIEVQKTIEAEYKRLDVKNDNDYTRVLMLFTRTDVGKPPKDKKSGEKVIIESISERSLPIIYASDLAEQRIKHEIREGDDNIFKKGFSVDVSVERRNGKPVVYRILHVHEVIDLLDEDEA